MNVLNQTNLVGNKLIARFDARLGIYGTNGVRYCIGPDGILREALKPISEMSGDLSDNSSWSISGSGFFAHTLQEIREVKTPYDGMLAHFVGDLPTHKYYIFSTLVSDSDADLLPLDGTTGGWNLLNTGSGGSLELATFNLVTTNAGLTVTFADGSTSKSLPKADLSQKFDIVVPNDYNISSISLDDPSHSSVSYVDDDTFITIGSTPNSSTSITVQITLEDSVEWLSKKNLLDNSTSSDLNSLKKQLFKISYDSDANHRITDGGSDTYDMGNYVYFNYGSEYSQRHYIASGTSNEVGFVYRTRGLMVWQGTNVIACKTDGGLGSDGNTIRNNGGSSFSVGSKTIYYRYIWSDDESAGTTRDPRVLRMVLSYEPVNQISHNGNGNDKDRHEFIWSNSQSDVVFAQLWFYNNRLSYTYEQIAKILIGAL